MVEHPKQHQITVTCSSCSSAYDLFFDTSVKGPLTVESCSSCHPAYTGKRRSVELNAARKFFDKYKNYSSQIGSSAAPKDDAKADASDDAS